jgi:hypothetical protein
MNCFQIIKSILDEEYAQIPGNEAEKAEADQFLKSLKQETFWQQDNIKMYGKEIPLPRLKSRWTNLSLS